MVRLVERHRKVRPRIGDFPGRRRLSGLAVDYRDGIGDGQVHEYAGAVLFELNRFRLLRQLVHGWQPGEGVRVNRADPLLDGDVDGLGRVVVAKVVGAGEIELLDELEFVPAIDVDAGFSFTSLVCNDELVDVGNVQHTLRHILIWNVGDDSGGAIDNHD